MLNKAKLYFSISISVFKSNLSSKMTIKNKNDFGFLATLKVNKFLRVILPYKPYALKNVSSNINTKRCKSQNKKLKVRRSNRSSLKLELEILNYETRFKLEDK